MFKSKKKHNVEGGQMMTSIMVPCTWNQKRINNGWKWKYIIRKGIDTLEGKGVNQELSDMRNVIAILQERRNRDVLRISELEKGAK